MGWFNHQPDTNLIPLKSTTHSWIGIQKKHKTHGNGSDPWEWIIDFDWFLLKIWSPIEHCPIIIIFFWIFLGAPWTSTNPSSSKDHPSNSTKKNKKSTSYVSMWLLMPAPSFSCFKVFLRKDRLCDFFPLDGWRLENPSHPKNDLKHSDEIGSHMIIWSPEFGNDFDWFIKHELGPQRVPERFP